MDPSGKELVRRGDIPALIEDELVQTAFGEWHRFRRFGLPHARGWAAERPVYVRIIEICEQEYDLYQAQEIGKHTHGK
jgi:hypothetical protein